MCYGISIQCVTVLAFNTYMFLFYVRRIRMEYCMTQRDFIFAVDVRMYVPYVRCVRLDRYISMHIILLMMMVCKINEIDR
jgi:hypothetical protein